MAANNQGFIALSTLVSQLSHLRDVLDPDMTALAMAIFVEVATHSADEGVPMSRIVDKFKMSASTASRNIYLLSSGFVRPGQPRKGLGVIRTDTSPVDRRSLQVYLTPRGQAIIKGLLQVK
jgi:DNA-binding MarR family transcriptional regulator